MAYEMSLYGLAYECLFRRRKNDCPFKEIDFLSFHEKFDWINGISELKKSTIWEHHVDCSFNNKQTDYEIIMQN